ncbi:MAG: sulfurtransferase TusA family protein [Euryarchaeota archaeon]|jgi:TusA-related sulfurtransferase|nr:sulfurtransferase TusA family protein [Euryarchaeota archaeon]MBT3757210.1 sulfurtransferase TusA family protein [Euryarchaeota archaeon]MBT4050973.1 sulfurtransferase TusA family protein [Euryarchaeota archaeon]MBT4346749.1 sulfurtransferase TusA family protein [Euryarchaeota archaeon]MBT4649804.1 sulfurtransferase TusA family protein [Euryarchaeota archaeon]|tara:strand:- start:794 stop:1264 length:471 start_codon:yes stop_codon:yes gene_type:complete
MSKFESKSNLTCPVCKTSEKLNMPTDQCIIVHNCINCNEILQPKNGDCCVFCSYGDVPCPPIQLAGNSSASNDKRQDLAIISLDLLGFFCPIPVHETRKKLHNVPKGAILEVICDDPETLQDIPILCDRLNIQLLEIKDEAGELIFLIKNQAPNVD